MRMPRLFLVLTIAAGSTACGGDDERRDGLTGRDLFPQQWLDSGGCSVANCMGCCQNGQCQPGTANTACGYGGISCRPCTGGEQCKDGVCVTGGACGPASCPAGCCDPAGNCMGGGTVEACGMNGLACKTCDEATQVCLQGQCTAKGSGSYKITLVSALISGGCGLGETCDPYVELTVGGVTKTSATKGDTETPTWNQELMTAKESDILNGLGVKVMDEDWGPDDTVGTCTLKVTAADLAAGKLVQHCGDRVKDLTFSFQPS
jgi:hypothetical protein